jgi:deoxyribonuclease-4
VLVGGHVSSSGGIHTAIDRIEAIGGNAVQIFTQSPRMWRPTTHDPANLERFRERAAEADIRYALCHALYLINLASPDEELYGKSMTALTATVEVARQIGADVVFHVGSHLGVGLDAALARVVPALERALERTGDATWLLLENSAGAGGTIGRSIDELAVIVDRAGRPPRLGLCLDSCHLWVSGVDVGDPAVVSALVDEVHERVGLERLRAIHVNDAAAPLGSNRDRHANVGEGLIGDRLAAVLGEPRLRELPFLLETPGPDGHGPDGEQVRRLRALWESAGQARRRRPARADSRRPGRSSR